MSRGLMYVVFPFLALIMAVLCMLPPAVRFIVVLFSLIVIGACLFIVWASRQEWEK